MIRKLFAIVLAVLINSAVLAGFNLRSTQVVAVAAPARAAQAVPTLPTINVRPTQAQIERLRRERQSTRPGLQGSGAT